MYKMGPNSEKREYRRRKLFVYLLTVSSTSYKCIREKLDVTDKTIRDDLAYLQDIKGVIIESKPGVGGYVRISQEWRKRKCPMTPEQEQAMLIVFKKETDPQVKMVLFDIIVTYCSPAIYEDKV